MKQTDDKQLIDSVLRTWFEDTRTDRMDIPQTKRWFMGGKKLDELLSARFSKAVLRAQTGDLDHWLNDITGALAHVILSDQFSRNIHRGTAQAFAGDAKALEIARHVLSTNSHEHLTLTHKVFLYMPFEHDESRESQKTSIQLFTQLREQAPPELAQFAQATLDSAIEHKDIIDLFGRYPHRNATLSRHSTAAEVEWLASKAKRFGQ